MSKPVAAVTSAPSQIGGNDNNTSLDFQFLELPASGNLTVSIENNPNPGGITFNLWHSEAGRDGKVATDLKSGSLILASSVSEGDDYYIGNASNAGGQNFVVVFLAG